MSIDPPSFNVLDEPSLWVVAEEGPKLVTLKDALINAHEYLGIDLSRPLASLPTLRLLVAIILRTHQVVTPADAEKLWRQGRFDATAVLAYSEKWHERFDLYSPTHPFLQVPGLEFASGPPKPVTQLRLEVSSGNNVPHTSAYTEADNPVLPAQEALSVLLSVQGYDTAALKPGAKGDPAVTGGTTKGNHTGPLGGLGGVFPTGENLFVTLLLNLPWLPISGDDAPIWERELGPQWETRPARGVLEQFTWPARRVRLVPDAEGNVTGVVLAAGDRLVPLQPDLEPHTRWVQGKPGEALRPRRWLPGRQPWREFPSLLGQDVDVHAPMLLAQLQQWRWLPEQHPLGLVCVGVHYGNKSAVIEDVTFDRLPLPVAALVREEPAVRAAVVDTIHMAESLRRAVNDLERNIRLSEGGEEPDVKKGLHPGDALTAALEAPTLRMLEGLQREPNRYDEAIVAWEEVAHDLAWQFANPLLDGAQPRAVRGTLRKVANKERMVRLSDAEAWFRKSLYTALQNYADTLHERSA